MNGVLLALALALQPAPQPLDIPAMVPPPAPDQVMAIPDRLREEFRREVLDATRFPEARLEKLVAFVFNPSKLGVQYKADATQTVAESFDSRTVNCLSSTILIVALAREAGLQAEGQEVQRILSWGSVGETVVQSMHANAIVKVGDKRKFVVDVDSSDVLATDALNPVSDEQLLASFYGNRAMELMLAGRLVDAKAWLDSALRHAPDDAILWNNAGVLSRRMGDMATAEKYFLKAVAKNPRQMSVVSNLVALYRGRGDDAQSTLWQARADKILRNDPYYQFTLGQQLEQSGNFPEAVRQYRRAVKLNRNEHRFHFGLARVYYKLGEFRGAGRELALAEELSQGPVRDRYQDKLAALKKIAR
ncbi:MAG: tetratricopeptide repeat protein [Lysobacteraceae bacterium]|nr:MAG: tetratricopeptide repeat protein [Xanthomonadaceae bacterium]